MGSRDRRDSRSPANKRAQKEYSNENKKDGLQDLISEREKMQKEREKIAKEKEQLLKGGDLQSGLMWNMDSLPIPVPTRTSTSASGSGNTSDGGNGSKNKGERKEIAPQTASKILPGAKNIQDIQKWMEKQKKER